MARFELVLMRHGEAEDFADGGDAQRQLTERGHAMAERAGRLLASLDWAPTLLVCSPFVRTRQTLEGVAATLGTSAPIDVEPRLVPGSPPSNAIASLVRRAEEPDTRLLVVGHNPCVSGMLARLVCGDERMAFAVSTGDLAHLSVERRDASAVVLSYIPARVLEALG